MEVSFIVGADVPATTPRTLPETGTSRTKIPQSGLIISFFGFFGPDILTSHGTRALTIVNAEFYFRIPETRGELPAEGGATRCHQRFTR
ncbi:hypothetical protein [Mycobacterium sp. 236(2023)]|uniref:hypothetical protein n=1 Tax=Mycobacterium sp. 236(2023) TaxID=3038163 RepID=UPI002414F9CE|nr:hypothetical protein [Mycobacterium sp. 236(2023)]MDG4669384.1 hypothetical protein [Mycobacterium sp. 236(2023)]